MGRWVGGAHRIPAAGAEREPDHTTACGGIDSPVERAYAVDERRDTPLSPCSLPSAKTYFTAIDAKRRSRLGVVRALIQT